jgi:hypothetical protein
MRLSVVRQHRVVVEAPLAVKLPPKQKRFPAPTARLRLMQDGGVKRLSSLRLRGPKR